MSLFVSTHAQIDPNQPSFFEMVYQQLLMSNLKPAVEYTLSVIASRHPRLNVIVDHIDEFYALMLLFLEHSYLWSEDASFSENMYGLCRTSTDPERQKKSRKYQQALQELTKPSSNSNSGNSKGGDGYGNGSNQAKPANLTENERRWSLFFIVVVPYLKSKLDQYYAAKNPGHVVAMRGLTGGPANHNNNNNNNNNNDGDDGENNEANNSNNNNNNNNGPAIPSHLPVPYQHFLRVFHFVYPGLNAAYEGVLFGYQLLYLFEKTKYFSPFFHLLQLELRRLSMAELTSAHRKTQSQQQEALQRIASNLAIPEWMRSLQQWLLRGWFALGEYSQYMLYFTLFALRFLEWWYSEDSLMPTEVLPVPPPPKRPPRHRSGLAIPALSADTCALCKQQRVNPTMTPAGYAYCFKCIFTFVETKGHDPVTLQRVTVEQLRRLYETV